MTMATAPSEIRQFLAATIGGLALFSSGAAYTWITPLLHYFLQPDSEITLTSSESSWAVALIELGNVFMPLPAGFLVDFLGRKWMLWLASPLYLVTWILLLVIRTRLNLYLMRFVQGVAMSVQYTVLPMYLAEIAGPKLRGAVTTFFQGMWYLGILYTYIVGSFFSYEGLTWFAMMPNIVFMVLFFWCPESPYFLVWSNRSEKAARSLAWLRGGSPTDRHIVEELNTIKSSIEEERSKGECSWLDIFRTKEGRKALFLVNVMAVALIMTGQIALLIYLTDTVIVFSGDVQLANYITIAFGTLLLSLTLATFCLADSLGRRPILLISLSGGTFFLACSTVSLYLIEVERINSLALQILAYASLIVYGCFISFGVGTLLPVLQSEFFPSSTRGIAAGITTLNITVMSFFSLKVYQVISDHLGVYVNYLIFTCFSLTCLIIVYCLFPETKGKTFAEIQKMLSKTEDSAQNNKTIA